MNPNKWRIRKRGGRWLLYRPHETRHLTAGSFTYVVSAMNYAFNFYYMDQTKRWRDG
ncbi:hypothetical protein RGQ21_68110 [Kitasatospora aureofaciens]|nr:hypothetical protein RGQ21_68110 [Kitasatospora aureofaciens]